MPRRLLAGALVAGGLVLVACSSAPPYAPRLDTVTQRIVDEEQHYTGTGMADKQLALTFDDGPSVRTTELSAYLKAEGIHAVFFVNGACIRPTTLPNDSCPEPTLDSDVIMRQVIADGHIIGNHSTTHRDLTALDTTNLLADLTETNQGIVNAVNTPWNHFLFRAPMGFWTADNGAAVRASPLANYVGPIYWDIGGDADQYPDEAADWACFQGLLLRKSDGNPVQLVPDNDGYATTKQCGDAYHTEITARGKGIVLMHDRYFWPDTGERQGDTVDMVKYLVPILKAEGYTFVRADEIDVIKNDFPACGDRECKECSGPAADQCTKCIDEGTTVAGGSCHRCLACPPGTYVAKECSAAADTVCTPCAAGTFVDKPNQASCTACPEGSFSTESASACTACGDCNDGDACTADRCTATGCVHDPIANCARPLGPPVKFDDDDSGPAPKADDSGCNASGASSADGAAWLLALAIALVRRQKSPAVRITRRAD